jgi:hypothetical protein
MERPRNHPSSSLWRVDATVSSDLISLENLKMRDIINFSAGSKALLLSTGDSQVKGLLSILFIPRSNIASDDQSEIVLFQIGFECCWVDA